MKKCKNNVGAGPVPAHTSKARQNSGITLIALVITIIVMLILVAVTITMAVNGGLFEYAGNAGTQMNGAIANEQKFANLEDNMTVNQLIDKYTKKTGEEETPEVIVCDKCIDGVMQAYICAGEDGTKHVAELSTLLETRQEIARLQMCSYWTEIKERK